MTGRIDRTLRITAALVLTLALALSGFASVWAAPIDDDDPDNKAAVTKVLEVPIGTTTPAAEFTFEATLEGSGGPAITIPKITIAAGTEPLVAMNDIATVKGQTKDFIEDINASSFDDTGVYVYKITEKSATYTADATATYFQYDSKAEYRIYIYVKEAEGAKYIDKVLAWRTKDDNGNTQEEKVDPSPGDGVNTFSDMDFTNNFVKVASPVNPDPETYDLFHVSETVEDSSDTTYFPFSVTVSNPDFPVSDGLPKYYKAYVADADGLITDFTTDTNLIDDGTDDDYGDYYRFMAGVPKTVNLKHGQRLVFPGTPVGATWTVTEDLESDSPANYDAYTAKADVTKAGVTTVPYFTAPKGESLTVDSLVGEGANKADFTNSKAPILPMGIDVNNLPYIGLILLALAGLAIYVAAKTRRRKAMSNT